MNALQGGFADPPRDAAHAFRAAMGAMARPGTIHTVTGITPPAPLSVAAAVLILTLCDPDTPLFIAPSHDGPALRDWITFHTGAPLAGPANCAFAVGPWDALLPLSAYRIGTAEYPDRSATLIVELPALRGPGTRLTGPGIRDTAHLPLPDPMALATNAALFPLGIDLFLTCGADLAALPRSTRIG